MSGTASIPKNRLNAAQLSIWSSALPATVTNSRGKRASCLDRSGLCGSMEGPHRRGPVQENSQEDAAGRSGHTDAAQSVDLVAFLLSFNKFPAGKTELPSENESLTAIHFDVKKPDQKKIARARVTALQNLISFRCPDRSCYKSMLS